MHELMVRRVRIARQERARAHDQILLNTTPQGGAIRVGDWKLVLNGINGTGATVKHSPNQTQIDIASARSESAIRA